MNDATRQREQLLEQLVAAGRLRSPAWIAAFRNVPRHQFVRRFFRQTEDLSGWLPVDATDPDAISLLYRDTSWVTQLDHEPARWERARSTGEPARGTPTSSSTAPGLLAVMLEALDVQDGHRVLQIGTGSGYTAALLCERLGSDQVTTVEVDPVVADAASTALREVGYAPTIVVGDGTVGAAIEDGYDRLIATCSVPDLPAAWLRHTRPGGAILTSLHRDLGGGTLVRLWVDGGGGAEGRFLPTYGSFMPIRTAPVVDPAARLAAALATYPAAAPARATRIPPEALDSNDFGMVAALQLPGVASIGFDPATGPQRWLLADDGSWACVDESAGTVSQSGARRLWDEVEDIHEQWVRRGRPIRERLGLTVTSQGEHRFWVDGQRTPWWTSKPTAAGSTG
ncbi:MAG TPA: ATP-grasp peptide maturase system methyltransferase [Natronosporangium sp.]